MLTSVTTLLCATPERQPQQPVSRVSATATTSCRNSGRGYAKRSGAIAGARSMLGQAASVGIDFEVLPNTPVPGRWSWQRTQPGRRPPGTKTSETWVLGHKVLPKSAQDRPSLPARRPDGLIVGSREAVMVDLCLRPDGVSRTELRTALGWRADPYPSLVVACDKANITLSVLRHGEGPYRYRGRYQGGMVNPLSIAPVDLAAAGQLTQGERAQIWDATAREAELLKALTDVVDSPGSGPAIERARAMLQRLRPSAP